MGLTCFCPLFTFAGYPAAVAESEKILSPLHYTTALDTSHNPVTRSHDKELWTAYQTNFGLLTKRTLLKLFNESWKTGTVPAMWKKTTIIPIHKKGKDKENPNSYRPISLQSCLGKLLEKVINRRLLSFLKDNNVLSQTQTGYRKYRSTEDQLALIAQEIENAFQEKKKVVAVFFDLTKAVDKVWREGLLLEVLQSRVSGRMYKWIRCFLQERSARVKLDGYMSESVKMREGVP